MTKRHFIQRFTIISVLVALVVVSGVLHASLAAAQGPDDASPTPAPSPTPVPFASITTVREFPVFPAGILFWIRVEARFDETERIDLTFRQNEETVGRGAVPEPLDQSLVFGFDNAGEYRFFLDFEDYPEIDFFEDLLYRIEVEALDGTQTFFEGVLRVEHQEVGGWQTADIAEQVTLHWFDDNLSGEELLRELDDVLFLLQQSLETVQPIEVALYAPFEPYCDTVTDEEGNIQQVVVTDRENFPCSEELAEAVYAERGIEYITMQNVVFAELVDRLTEVLVNAQYDEQWQGAGVPAWFRRGLARYFLMNTSTEPLQRVQRAAQIGNILRYEELITLPDLEDEAATSLWNAHAQLLVKYIADLQGADAPLTIADQLAEGDDFATVFMAVMETDVRTFYAAWRIWLDTSAAQQAAQWNPYVPITPTPTLTMTPSEVPPTRLPVPTSTITPTWTPRPLFVPTDPPRPTRAPPTVRPTNTFTPLPPGFFDNQTPTPAPAVNDDDGRLCSAGIGTLLLPLIAGLVVWRRKHG